MFVDASEAEEFSEVASKPLRSLPYDSPGQTFVAFEKPEGVLATGKFSNILKFIVKEVLFVMLPLSLLLVLIKYPHVKIKSSMLLMIFFQKSVPRNS